MSAPGIDPKDFRVSDDERSHVLHLLEKATGRGLIDLDEYNSRSRAVIGAKTRGDLNAVLLDLPGLQIAGRSVDAAASDTREQPWAPPSSRVPRTMELTGWGVRSFKGHWVVPERIIIGGAGASTKLDFTAAQFSSPRVTIEFRGNFSGATELVVPAGTAVRMEGLQIRNGQVQNKVPPDARGGGPELVLTGVKKGGTLVIRNPRTGWFS